MTGLSHRARRPSPAPAGYLACVWAQQVAPDADYAEWLRAGHEY
jgi:hypothetical protein